MFLYKNRIIITGDAGQFGQNTDDGYYNQEFYQDETISFHNKPGTSDLPPYSFFQVKYKRNFIDLSAAIVKNDLAIKVGFRDKSLAGDATYFEDIFKSKYPEKLKCLKIPRVLFVHNQEFSFQIDIEIF